jgi:hypothetical protein
MRRLAIGQTAAHEAMEQIRPASLVVEVDGSVRPVHFAGGTANMSIA